MYYNQCSIDEKILSICKNEYQMFLNKRNVIGIGLGYKSQMGFYTCQKCIVVFVTKKVLKNQLCSHDIVASNYKGIPTDVIECGIIKSASLTQKVRPAIGGYSVGPGTVKEEVGSIGCLVTDGHTKYILGCNHVLADGNRAILNTPILQPSRHDGGVPGVDEVASLDRFTPLQYESVLHSPANYVDCAIARLVSSNIVSSSIAFIGIPQGIIHIQLNQNVQKVGRTSELTHGRIKALGATIRTQFKRGRALFKDQIVTTKMTRVGDSGALLLDYTNFAVGLFFAEDNSYSYFNPIYHVLDALDVNIVTN